MPPRVEIRIKAPDAAKVRVNPGAGRRSTWRSSRSVLDRSPRRPSPACTTTRSSSIALILRPQSHGSSAEVRERRRVLEPGWTTDARPPTTGPGGLHHSKDRSWRYALVYLPPGMRHDQDALSRALSAARRRRTRPADSSGCANLSRQPTAAVGRR
jgi:hypothetical protein